MSYFWHDFLEMLNLGNSCWLLSYLVHIQQFLKSRYLQFLAHDDFLLSNIYAMFPAIALKHFSTKAVISFMHTVNPYDEKDVPYSANPYEQYHSDHGIKIFSSLWGGSYRYWIQIFEAVVYFSPVCHKAVGVQHIYSR